MLLTIGSPRHLTPRKPSDALLYGQLTRFLSMAGKNSGSFVLSWVNKKANPVCNFGRIMEMGNHYGANSSSSILLVNKQPGLDGCQISELNRELRTIVRSAWEVDLHGSSQAYVDSDIVKSVSQNLEETYGKPIIGYRNHLLRYRLLKKWVVLEEAGFRSDSTFGYADHIAFRNSMCHPFMPFHRVTDRQMNLREIPLVIMDVTLEGYMHFDMKKVWR